MLFSLSKILLSPIELIKIWVKPFPYMCESIVVIKLEEDSTYVYFLNFKGTQNVLLYLSFLPKSTELLNIYGHNFTPVFL